MNKKKLKQITPLIDLWFEYVKLSPYPQTWTFKDFMSWISLERQGHFDK